jgi:peptidoglycan/xylan/chitin deacetylase (PgdA/CDA1 family)
MPAHDHAHRRLDRWITLRLGAALAAWTRSRREPCIPILMYHSVSDDADIGVHPYLRTVTTPPVFAAQVALLRSLGYSAVTLSDAARLLQRARRGEAVPALDRKVVMTFDDGFEDVYSTVLPVLQKAGFSATVFMPSEFIGKPFINGRTCLTAAQLRQLHANGIEVGSHSASHGRLVEMSRADLAHELGSSKRQLEDCTGSSVTTFSFPFRFPQADRRFVAMLQDLLGSSGYEVGVTTTIGRASGANDPLLLPRLPVNDGDDDALFSAKLRGHYDWLRTGQRMTKACRELLRPLRTA